MAIFFIALALCALATLAIIKSIKKNPEKWKTWHKVSMGCFGAVILFLFFILGIVLWKTGDEPKVQASPEQVHRKKLESAFSQWDGSHKNLVQYVKDNMNDPKSFEHVQTNFWDYGTDTIIIKMTYRGKNMLGGTVTELVRAEALLDGTLLKVTKQ